LYTARIDDRLSGGLEGLHYQEGRDAAVVEYALANPLDMILGHGTGGIDFWIMDMDYLVEWNAGRTGPVTPAYLFTRLLGDLGLIGIGLLLLAWVPWANKLAEARLPAYRQFLIAGGLTLVFASVLSLNAYLLISASMVAYACRAEMPSQAPAADRVSGWQRQQGHPVRPG
jgi:hypothetical protein